MAEREGAPVNRARFSESFYEFCRQVAKAAVKPLFSVHYFGAENIPESGNLILCCNHKSVFDPILLALPFRRPVCYMAKSELFTDHGAFVRSLLTRLGAFPVKRNRGDRKALRTAAQILRSGGILGIFPQGGVVAQETPFTPKAGAPLLAGKTGAPILPAAICCSGALHPFQRGAIRFGHMICREEFPLRKGSVDIRALGALLAKRVNELLEAGF